MVNFCMLYHGRPVLLRQALDSIGDTSDMVFSLHGEVPHPDAFVVANEFMFTRPGTLTRLNENRGTGMARNQSIRAASNHGRGDFLYLSDDDVYFIQPDWMSILIENFRYAEHDGFAAVGAYNHPFNQPVPTWNGYGRVAEVYALATQSMLMRWETWDRFGPFCQTPPGKVCQSEDVDFSNRIRSAGLKVGTLIPPLLANTGITNSCGEKIPGWELVKSQCPQGVICE